ncbi:histidine kinase [candidate division MSBL1 archaeon SCGC-AAA382A20]|uniref:histidine kinase n=1 Tax=candidate division MSBL1 archaeon SCGC-AAA382A20 TaxID=1698280 RepID=A0A133VMJ0_9EURY|nr:histidine kinase [candidate division MSBL1 archaeon SCGC-AAA382A20]
MSDLDKIFYREAFRTIDIPSFIADEDYLIRDMNEAGLEFTGYSYEEIIGKPIPVISGDKETYLEIEDTVSEGENWTGDFSVKTKSGELVFGRGAAAPLIIDGKTKGHVAIFVDTTKQQRFENAEKVLNRLLRHDLRNDLNKLYGYIQRAQSKIGEESSREILEEGKELLSSIIHKSERARNLREYLVDSFKAKNGPVRLDLVLNDTIVDLINQYEEAEFHFEDFPKTLVLADDLLSTVLESVIENAVEHNDKENPVVEIIVKEVEEQVIIEVCDNGPGIPEEQKDLVFGRIEDDLHHGTGLSLFFADNVVKSYSGDIWVEDNQPEGSIFKIKLQKA